MTIAAKVMVTINSIRVKPPHRVLFQPRSERDSKFLVKENPFHQLLIRVIIVKYAKFGCCSNISFAISPLVEIANP